VPPLAASRTVHLCGFSSVALNDDAIVGACLVAQGAVVHTVLFPMKRNGSGTQETSIAEPSLRRRRHLATRDDNFRVYERRTD